MVGTERFEPTNTTLQVIDAEPIKKTIRMSHASNSDDGITVARTTTLLDRLDRLPPRFRRKVLLKLLYELTGEDQFSAVEELVDFLSDEEGGAE